MLSDSSAGVNACSESQHPKKDKQGLLCYQHPCQLFYLLYLHPKPSSAVVISPWACRCSSSNATVRSRRGAGEPGLTHVLSWPSSTGECDGAPHMYTYHMPSKRPRRRPIQGILYPTLPTGTGCVWFRTSSLGVSGLHSSQLLSIRRHCLFGFNRVLPSVAVLYCSL